MSKYHRAVSIVRSGKLFDDECRGDVFWFEPFGDRVDIVSRDTGVNVTACTVDDWYKTKLDPTWPIPEFGEDVYLTGQYLNTYRGDDVWVCIFQSVNEYEKEA